ncbi:MAG: transglutaminase-like domain-containing protein [Microgenomates group bacterium]
MKWQFKEEKVILALPQTNHYQKIENLFFPSSSIIFSDKFGNLILISKKDNKNKIISFDYFPYSVSLKIPKFSLNDYPFDLLKKYSFLFKPDRFVNGESREIKKIIKNWQKEKDVSNLIEIAYNYVLENLVYGNPIKGLYSFSQALKEKITDCGGFSTVLLSLLKGLKIPGRLVVGFILNKKIFFRVFPLNWDSFFMHVWVEVLLPDGQWFPLDPAIEWRRKKGLTTRKGGFGIIPADRLVVSFGQDFKIKINKKIYKIDIFQFPISIYD